MHKSPTEPPFADRVEEFNDIYRLHLKLPSSVDPNSIRLKINEQQQLIVEANKLKSSDRGMFRRVTSLPQNIDTQNVEAYFKQRGDIYTDWSKDNTELEIDIAKKR